MIDVCLSAAHHHGSWIMDAANLIHAGGGELETRDLLRQKIRERVRNKEESLLLCYLHYLR
jgi:hypothetical protein